jgi:hypothetical protein
MKYIIVFTLIFNAFTSKAQHCHLDGSNVIIVEVLDSNSQEVINGLTLTLCDSLGVPYASEWNIDNCCRMDFNVKSDTLIFGQNKIRAGAKTTNSNGPYAFARNCYLLEVYGNNYPNFNLHGKDLIRIEDKRGRYNTISVLFSVNQIASLCTDYQWKYEREGIDQYKITVYLQKKIK